MTGSAFNMGVWAVYILLINGDVFDESFMPLCTDELKNAMKSTNLRVTVIKRRGAQLVLPCQFCGYEESVSQKRWFCTSEILTGIYTANDNTVTYETLEPSDRRDIAPNGALKLTNVNPSDAKTCHCTSTSAISLSNQHLNYSKLEYVVDVEEDVILQAKSGSVYDWTVFQTQSYVLVNLMLINPDANLALNIRASPDWTEWSTCDRCEDTVDGDTRRPSRRRTAFCRLKSLRHPKIDSISVRRLMQMYDRGLSCITSRLFSKFSRRIQSALLIPPFAVVEKCNKTCISGERRLEITRKQVVYKVKATEGSNVKLACPGALHDTPATWYNGSRRLSPTLITASGPSGGVIVNRTSVPRLHLDADQMLHILSVTVHDSNVYGCWTLRRERASIQLVVSSVHGLREFCDNSGVFRSYLCLGSLRHFVYVAMAAALSFLFYLVAVAIVYNYRLSSTTSRHKLGAHQSQLIDSTTEHVKLDDLINDLGSEERLPRVQKFLLLKELLEPNSLGF